MKAFLGFACAAACLLIAGTASATNSNTCTQKRPLKFFSQDTGGILWQSGRHDSPRDTDGSRVMVHVLFQDNVFPYDYAGAYGECTQIIGKTLGQVRNLSFEFMNTSRPLTHPVHVTGGSPRYSIDLDTDGDGDYDTSALPCRVPLRGSHARIRPGVARTLQDG